MTAFQLVQTLYWIALATWFGGLMFVAIAAPVVFSVVKESRPILPEVLSVNLENEHGNLLAGGIVGGVLRQLSTIFLFCAGAIGVMLVVQWFVMGDSTANRIGYVVRCTLFLACLGLSLYDRYALWPKVWRYRQEYVDNADDPDVANEAKDNFDRYQKESLRILVVTLVLLSLMIVFSAGITPRLM
jgi:putative copper export protein